MGPRALPIALCASLLSCGGEVVVGLRDATIAARDAVPVADAASPNPDAPASAADAATPTDAAEPPLDATAPADLTRSPDLAPPAPRHAIASIGAEEMLGSVESSRPSIAVDSLLQPHVVADRTLYSDSVLDFHDRKAGAWSTFSLDVRTYNAHTQTTFAPHQEIDAADRAWISTILFATKRAGVSLDDARKGCAMGLMLRPDVALNPRVPAFSALRISPIIDWDPGHWCLDPARPDQAVAFAYEGHWVRFGVTPAAPTTIAVVDRGQMFPGRGGEKNIYRISTAGSVSHADGTSHGVWHAAVGGYSGWSSSYQNSVRHAQGHPPVAYAAYSTYKSQGDDSRYPGLAADAVRPQTAYIATKFGEGGIFVNLWDGAKMLFPTTANLHLDPRGNTGSVPFDRFPPQLAPAMGGGAFICWTRDSRVKLRFIAADASLGPEVDVTAGKRCAVAVDRAGDLHVAYVSGGGLRYRKLLVR